MACSTQRLHPVIFRSLLPNTRPSLQLRAHSQEDEDISGRFVDANLSILKERIQVVKTREKLEACYISQMGWNYTVGYAKKPKICEELPIFIQLFGWAIGSSGFTVFSGSFCLFIISLLVYFNQ